ncbi:MAG: hydroxymethylglutaryl-CoA reductase, partial [Spirochaetia bacterium]|nr:hydroxymethylglutaryl-CoA reductase [Spirochaetia bacterium]
FTGDASGHNMVTNAADKIFGYILEKYPELSYCSISGNYCCDKKVSAVNGILGRGRSVVAEITIPRGICEEYLHTTPEKIADINTKKNLLGSILAGSLRSANAHYANMLLAFYLATGQDAANIVEGSQGITFAEVKDDNLYLSCTLPNIIVGSVGNGKNAPYAEENLAQLGCKEERNPGENGDRLTAICAATVLCGELSLLAAETNPGELMKAHIRIERGKR